MGGGEKGGRGVSNILLKKENNPEKGVGEPLFLLLNSSIAFLHLLCMGEKG